MISKIADQIVIQKPDEINESPFNKLRRYLKVVPFKDSKNWGEDFVLEHENNVPIAVILAQHLKDDDRREATDNLETIRNYSEIENKLENNIDSITEIIPIAENRLDDIEAVGSKEASKETGIANEVGDIPKPSVRVEGHSDLSQDDNDILGSIERSKEFEIENYDRVGNDNTELDSNISQTNEMDIIFKTISDSNDIQNKESSIEENAKVDDFYMESNDSFKMSSTSNDLVDKDNDESGEISQNRKKYLTIKEYSFTEDGLKHSHYSLNFVFNL